MSSTGPGLRQHESVTDSIPWYQESDVVAALVRPAVPWQTENVVQGSQGLRPPLKHGKAGRSICQT